MYSTLVFMRQENSKKARRKLKYFCINLLSTLMLSIVHTKITIFETHYYSMLDTISKCVFCRKIDFQ